MSVVLVVNHDPRFAELEAEMIRAAGHQTVVCSGPTADACPVLRTLPCPLVDGADVLVYDVWVLGEPDGGRSLVAELRDTYPDLPMILTSVDRPIDWVEVEGPHRVIPLEGYPTVAVFRTVIERALEEQGMAV